MRLQIVQWTQNTYILLLCALRVNKCEFSVYTVRIFIKCTNVCAAQKAYYIFTKLSIEHDFPSLADKIAEPHPDMNIKVAALAKSQVIS